MHVQLTKLNEKIELEVIENTDVLIFAQFNTIFISYELKLTTVFSCDSDSLSNALVLYLSLVLVLLFLLWLIKDVKINY
ncbi:MAG: hypothetical protein SOT25_01480 [Malacoplasma sp.]|nr:hypothetical protein [Malacoplasma sp.]